MTTQQIVDMENTIIAAKASKKVGKNATATVVAGHNKPITKAVIKEKHHLLPEGLVQLAREDDADKPMFAAVMMALKDSPEWVKGSVSKAKETLSKDIKKLADDMGIDSWSSEYNNPKLRPNMPHSLLLAARKYFSANMRLTVFTRLYGACVNDLKVQPEGILFREWLFQPGVGRMQAERTAKELLAQAGIKWTGEKTDAAEAEKRAKAALEHAAKAAGSTSAFLSMSYAERAKLEAAGAEAAKQADVQKKLQDLDDKAEKEAASLIKYYDDAGAALKYAETLVAILKEKVKAPESVAAE